MFLIKKLICVVAILLVVVLGASLVSRSIEIGSGSFSVIDNSSGGNTDSGGNSTGGSTDSGGSSSDDNSSGGDIIRKLDSPLADYNP